MIESPQHRGAWLSLDAHGFSLGEASPFPLYHRSDDDVAVRWREAGHSLTRDDLEELRALDIEALWVSADAAGAFARFLRTRFHRSLSDSGPASMGTGRALEQALLYSVLAVMDEPGAPEHRCSG